MRIGNDRRLDVAMLLDVELLEDQRYSMERVQVVEPTANVTAGGHGDQLEGRVAIEQPRGQCSREAGGAEHRDAMSHGPCLRARRRGPR